MKEKKKKLPLILNLISWSFPKLEKVAPKTANKWALNLFFTPIRFPFPASEQELLAKAELFSINYKNTHLQGYQWGTGKKSIFLAHGWAGRSSQLYKFIPHLVEKGYQVIAIDQLAHGKSKGKRTNIIDFVNVMKLVLEKFKTIEGVIAHSMRGVATLLALREETSIKNFVCISAPTLSDKILNSFKQRIKASDKVISNIKDYVQNRYEVDFKDFFLPAFQEELPKIDTLIIHDTDDSDVSIEDAKVFNKLLPHSELLITEKLGHTRILRNEKVIISTVSFLTKKNLN